MMILEGTKGKEKYYSPLLYCPAELVRNNDRIILKYDIDEISINVGLIASLLENNEDYIENIINQLIEIERPEQIDFKKVLLGLINLDEITIKDETAIILARTPESIAGLVAELRTIADSY